MDSIYFKKCLVCSVIDKENELRCKKCSGKLTDIQRILIEAKSLRDEPERARRSFILTLAAPLAVLLFILIILNPLIILSGKIGVGITTFSFIEALIYATIFIAAGHFYSKRYIAATFFAVLIPLSLVLLNKTYFKMGVTFLELLADNEFNFGIIAMFFTFIVVWLLIAHDVSKGAIKEKKAPCQLACPAGIDVPHYISLISDGKYEVALNLIRENNPLPAVIGRICPHPCEIACIRGIDGKPIAINPLKRYVSDYEREIKKEAPKLEVLNRKNEKIAIIGSGPSGLSAAYYLARLGVMSTIYEKYEVAGGMLAVGIPKYRLPRDVLEYEVDIIRDLGVTIETNSPIGNDKESIQALLDKGYDAVLIAVGAQNSMKLRIAGEDSDGISDCLTFLRDASLKEEKVVGGKAMVIGGGNAAVDAARTLLRLGTERVTLLYRRSRNEMPASLAEVEAAEDEGVIFEYLAAPKMIIAEAGMVKAVECIKMSLGEPDSSGRRRPVPIKGSEFKLEVNNVIAAIGQAVDTDFIKYDEKIDLTDRNLLKVDGETYMTSMDKVYSSGDCMTGPSTAINAIATGKKAALSIFYDLYKDKIKWPDYKDNYVKKCEIIDNERAAKKLRIKMPTHIAKERACSFSEVEKGYSEGMALEESLRCLKCHQELIE